MKKFTFSFLTVLIPALNSISATAQIVSDTDITRQVENTAPADNWVGYIRNAGTMDFVQGPGVPPAGSGSLQFATAAGADKAFLYNYDYNNTPLSALTALSYATYQTEGSPNQVAAVNLVIDFDGPAVAGGQAVLVFEPVYNPDQGTITSNTWQTWDALNNGNAIWWSPQPINGVCAFNCYVTWNQIVANNPQAIILGGFGLNQGSGNAGLISAADALTIGVNGTNTAYNFEAGPCNPVNTTIYHPKPNMLISTSSLVYPNPTSGALNIQLPKEKSSKADIIITDANGTVIESRKSKLDGQVETFNLSDNGPGLYLIKIVTKSKVEHDKAVVK